jgi:hypothetical protein
MKQRLILCLLGAWLMGSLMLFAVAPKNFHLIDELLASSGNPGFRHATEQLGQGAARELLRYLASELNRAFFSWWNMAQVLLGGAAVWATWGRTEQRWPRALVAAALILVLLLLLVLTPQIISVGRSLDFVPRTPAPPQLGRFQLLHVLYTGLDLVKVLCLGLATVQLLRGKPAAQSSPV